MNLARPARESRAVRAISIWLSTLALIASRALLTGGAVKLVVSISLVCWVALPQLIRLRTDPLDAPALYVASGVFLFGVMSLYWFGAGTPVSPPPGVDRDDVSN